MVPAPEVRLSARDIRARFNEGKYAVRASDDTDSSVRVRQVVDGGPAPAWAPPGARSQMIEYENEEGRVIAWAHQYGFPDGTCIPKKRADPKFLFEEGVRYKYDRRLDDT